MSGSSVSVNGLNLRVVERGSGPIDVVFVHGNLASVDWLDLVYAHMPPDLRIIAADWRGCGGSDKPAPLANFSNYSIAQHAVDQLAVMDVLGVQRCHLITHSTGGIISSRMLLEAPDRFGRVLALDPVAPMGLQFDEQGTAVFAAMKADAAVRRFGMAASMSTLFDPATIAPGVTPVFADGTSPDQRALFERLLEQTAGISDGIWFGTPYSLTDEYVRGELTGRMGDLWHDHLVLWGQRDAIIPEADMDRMATDMPACRVVKVPGVGHSMNVEQPAMFAGYVGGFLSGVAL